MLIDTTLRRSSHNFGRIVLGARSLFAGALQGLIIVRADSALLCQFRSCAGNRRPFRRCSRVRSGFAPRGLSYRGRSVRCVRVVRIRIHDGVRVGSSRCDHLRRSQPLPTQGMSWSCTCSCTLCSCSYFSYFAGISCASPCLTCVIICHIFAGITSICTSAYSTFAHAMIELAWFLMSIFCVPKVVSCISCLEAEFR